MIEKKLDRYERIDRMAECSPPGGSTFVGVDGWAALRKEPRSQWGASGLSRAVGQASGQADAQQVVAAARGATDEDEIEALGPRVAELPRSAKRGTL